MNRQLPSCIVVNAYRQLNTTATAPTSNQLTKKSDGIIYSIQNRAEIFCFDRSIKNFMYEMTETVVIHNV
ncbi:hypothetical protein T09_10689 [Trichinella sp. T9]|uniref:Uncharacterized protein n=1 Tax=Trichinella murrelli TaxID=144512 RepID=A0A0V0TNZ2_9BILA|nr:hypothetical protein T05_14322 [Trichinella murrelli]KRX67312.1 hypothetical protein T09_10689 [Trichinella sp. T9]KRZ84671.1 hypothetical protein T08_7890 [Trichinella sp. T8]